ncbi:hypothetical protein [Polymorphobacter fuscus]|uniref:Uncharacterized protein n=1 Tax=Sandarakinorhabdus fusca TaxID=1439888 RepID=A0A7C9KP48_9SPHN|nr:hypothetical protein [Polymorphobacter fuscus]KAB7644957.1 hypothetical protein F9290_13365 [Polymorphobacter fuscus]MQT18244.1 hypothetical protein [Polymorphobacter fuscus]NJC09568.1 hypothetical protein [Polymorphobacter fuscus]
MTAPPPWADPSEGTLPWLAVAGYLVAVVLCVRQRRHSATARERWFWTLAALAMLALGLNKQLDLQTALTAWGRQMARDDGWFAQRRAFQAAFVKTAAAVALVTGLAFAWLVRGMRRQVIVTLAGLMLLALFVVIRAASFHHIDVMMRAPVLGLKLHTLLELAGIAVVIAGAGWPQRQARLRIP